LGEIKSTLDLVLEKTRHLTLSEEEKAVQQREVSLKRLSGLLQKFGDLALSSEHLAGGLDEICRAGGLADADVLAEVLRRIDKDADNAPWLALLEDHFEGSLDPLVALLEEYQNARRTACDRRAEALLEQLARNRRICGTAVRPNLSVDETWAAQKAALDFRFAEQLELEKKRYREIARRRSLPRN
jgi:hypothetical protein